MKWIVLSSLVLSLVSSLPCLIEVRSSGSVIYSQEETGSPLLPPISSNWVATDGLGRTLPTYDETGSFKKNRYVGIFYFLWHGQNNDKAIYDISVLTKANPAQPKFGPQGAFHWWGEPEAGYFKADDPWVIRRNLQLLTLAGVDILFFDVTNADPYLSIVNKLCEISREMRNSGIPTPYICFLTNSKGPETIASIYQQFYAKGRYSELWFRWQGKPLILGKAEDMTDPAIRSFFTWRYSWAGTNARNEPHHWQWFDQTPQNYGWDTNPAIPEEIPVAVANQPVMNSGKSFRKGQQIATTKSGITPYTNYGLYFEEQWKRALQVNPNVVFVTGWNEWIAQRFINTVDPATTTSPPMFLGRAMQPGQTFFVDAYNEEYNRDIDPMKGGYTDNYYYQLVANIRRFKGMNVPEKASSAHTIKIDAQFDEWTTIKPAFTDPVGDVMHRDWPRSDQKLNYINNTGRNDIVISKITYDTKNIYFYAKTAQPLTASANKNWMLLFIDSDQSAKTGWAGYDFLINQSISGNTTTISHWAGKTWQPTAKGSLRYMFNELEISIPLSAIKKNSSTIDLDFHWADNIQQLTSITEFFTNGDSAPDRRFNYRYSNK